MKRILVVGPIAEREIEATARWYEAREPGLGEAFIVELLRALDDIEERADRLRLADQLNRDLASAQTDEPAQGGPALAARGRLLVYTGPIEASELDHRADREARIDLV